MTEVPVRKELDGIKADLDQLREDIAALTDAIKDVATEKINQPGDQARQSARDTWEDLEGKLDELLQQGRDGMEGVQQQIREHPSGMERPYRDLYSFIIKKPPTGRFLRWNTS